MPEEIWWCTSEAEILIFTGQMSSMNTNKTLTKEKAEAATRRSYIKKLFKKIIKFDMKTHSQDSIV